MGPVFVKVTIFDGRIIYQNADHIMAIIPGKEAGAQIFRTNDYTTVYVRESPEEILEAIKNQSHILQSSK